MKKNFIYIDNQSYDYFALETHCFEENMEQNFPFEERSVTLMGENDIIITHKQIDPDYINLLNNIGIACNCTFINVQQNGTDLVDSILKDSTLIKFLIGRILDGYIVDFFMFDERAKILCDAISFDCSERYRFFSIASKKMYLEVINKETGISIPKRVYTSNAFIAKQFVDNFSSQVLMKDDDSIGGLHIFDLSVEQRSIEELINLNGDMPMIFEEKLLSDYEGSIQFFVEDGIYTYYIDKCINENNQYIGFQFPYKGENLAQIDKDALSIINFIKKNFDLQNCIFGIDFIVKDNLIYYHDFNPRKTAVTYVLLPILRHTDCKDIGILTRYIDIKANATMKELIDFLKQVGLKIIDNDLEGVIILNPSRIELGKMQILAVSKIGKENIYIKKIISEVKKKFYGK